MKHYTIFCLLFLWGLGLQAQTDFKGEILSGAINTEYDEMMPRLAEGGEVLYFLRAQHPQNVKGRGGGQDIWMSKRDENGDWIPAVNMGRPLNSGLHNFVGGVAENGNLLYLGNSYGDSLPGIARSRRAGEGWSEPETVLSLPNEKENKRWFLSFFVTPDQSTVILSLTNGLEREDLYVMFRIQGGGYSEPKLLGNIINTDGAETAPFLANDDKTLFFTSNGLRDHLGGGDIYVTHRLDDTWVNWSEPVNLGPEVNTAGYEGYFILDNSGETAYFTSGPTPSALGDIYSISISDIPALRPADEVDTLYVKARHNQSVPLSFLQFGIPDHVASLTSSRSLDGEGEIELARSAPNYTYVPAQGFGGRELLELMYCDPPQSDECQRVIVIADVESAPQMPNPMVIKMRIPKGTASRMPLPRQIQDRIDLPRTLELHTSRNSSLKWNNETGGEYLRYTPQPTYVGEETVKIVGACKMEDANMCVVAVVEVEVFESPTVTVSDPPEMDPFLTETNPETNPLVNPSEPATFLLYGKVTDGNNKPIVMDLDLYEEENMVPVGKVTADGNGNYEVRLVAGKNYRIEANSPFHFPLYGRIPGNRESIKKDFSLMARPIEEGQTFVLKNIYFDVGQATLQDESTAELTTLFEFLKKNPTVEILVMGHTDNQSDESYNVQLSLDRVNSVIRYLKYKGVMGYRLQGQGLGESEPIDTNDTPEGRANNRRVEFKILKK